MCQLPTAVQLLGIAGKPIPWWVARHNGNDQNTLAGYMPANGRPLRNLPTTRQSSII